MRPRQFLVGSIPSDATWEPESGCRVPVRGPPGVVLELLKARHAAVIFSGNSIMRHVFFRFASFLRGVSSDNFTQSSRQAEKEMCTKELSPVARKEAGGFMKPFCKSGCCGVCSCASDVGNVPLYFVWQQEWYDARMRRIWDELFSSAPLQSRRVYLVMNAGLVNARVLCKVWPPREAGMRIVRAEAPKERLILSGGRLRGEAAAQNRGGSWWWRLWPAPK